MKKNKVITTGKVFLVGAGPAGRDLITVKGLEILRQADVVIHDYLVEQDLINEARKEAELINCRDLGKSHHHTSENSQQKINALMVTYAKQGKSVCRLKNGDPFIFGRATEELQTLNENNIAFEVIPGVTAAQAAAAFSGIPLTDRETSSSVVFVTGHESTGKIDSVNWQSIAQNQTIVLYMSVKNIAAIALDLIKAGKPANTPIAVISKAGKIDQITAVSTLKSIAALVEQKHITAPAIFIIGSTVKNEKNFNWIKTCKRILYTGTCSNLKITKNLVYHLPLIQIIPLKNYDAFDRHITKISDYDWIIFTSRHSVQYFFERFEKLGFDSRNLAGIQIAVIGKSTALRVKDFGINADLIAKEESTKGLLADLKKVHIKGKKILFPRSNIANKEFPLNLSKLGAKVTVLDAYQNIMPLNLPDIDINHFNEIVFTSPSGVRNFLKHYGQPLKKVKINCIGDVTKQEAKKWKLI